MVMTPEVLQRMNEAIDKLDIPEGQEMQLKVGKILCVKTFLERERKLINSDASETLRYPAFLRVVEVMRKLKEDGCNQ